jgi:hypothetical protein
MISRIKPIIYAFVLALGFGFLSPLVNKAEAKVYWDGVELKPGQIGRLTVLKQTPLYKLEGSKKVFVRNLKPGQKFRIYAFKSGMLSIGGGYYVDRDNRVKYETPSKAKLAQVKQEQLMDGVHFGMNMNQVQSIAGKTGTLIYKNSGHFLSLLYYSTEKFGANTRAEYFFEHNKLNFVAYNYFPNKDYYATTQEMDTVFYYLLEQGIEKFGDPGEITDFNYSKFGYYGHSATWTKDNMVIMLLVNDKNGYTIAAISFMPK